MLNNKITASILALGMVLAGFTLGTQLKNLRPAGSITVKGLAEMPYQADVANWQIGVSVWAENYGNAMQKAQEQTAQLLKFVAEQGLKNHRLGALIIEPKVEEYRDANNQYRTRENGFTATQTINITSQDLPLIQKSLSKLQTLKAQNDGYTFEQPQYLISNLEKIKQDLIAKATEDAKIRAQEFAKSGNTQIGNMKKASQGSFNIYASNQTDEESDYGGTYSKSTVDKTVRLVVSVEYSID